MRDYSGIVGNVRRLRAAEYDYHLRRLERPVDRGEWHSPPQTVNAFYNRGLNAITFPAGYLRPPAFDMDADDAVNYGAIGAVIGHEIGHAFDDQGSTHDGDGNMVDWWTAEDRTEFHRRTRSLIDQYNVLSPRALPDEYTVNGEFTVGENIGDLGGLSIALAAYRISLDGAESPVIDGLTGLQRTFIGWAQMRCAKVRPEEEIRRLDVRRDPVQVHRDGLVVGGAIVEEYRDALARLEHRQFPVPVRGGTGDHLGQVHLSQ